MKNKTILLLTLMISTLIFSQTNQFVYEYKFKMDSLNRDKSETELMLLETYNNGSKFYSQVKYIHDSTTAARLKDIHLKSQNHFDFSDIKIAKISYSVSKNYPDYKSIFRTQIGSTKVTLENQLKFDWKIEKEKDKILDYNVQKAVTNFQGRKWIAWFTSDIPIQDGPYRFHGLPGLILKLEDEKGDHVFKLIASKKINTEPNKNLNFGKKSSDIVINEEKFNKLWNDYKKDPAKSSRVKNSSNYNTVASITFNGKTYTNDEIEREIEKEAKERLKKENNYIELLMYK